MKPFFIRDKTSIAAFYFCNAHLGKKDIFYPQQDNWGRTRRFFGTILDNQNLYRQIKDNINHIKTKIDVQSSSTLFMRQIHKDFYGRIAEPFLNSFLSRVEVRKAPIFVERR